MHPICLALAPMEGITDPIVRAFLTEVGGIDYCVTEFIRVCDVPVPEWILLRDCPELRQQSLTPSGVPVHLQLLGSDCDNMAKTAEKAVSLGAKVIDLNFGCPVGRVNRHDGGAALLKTPQRMSQIIQAVRQAVPETVAVSAKIRLGWDNPDEVLTLAQTVQQAGASWVTIHGRTRAQAYGGQADWHRIGQAKANLSIPVVANGDINSPEALVQCQAITGCNRFLLGRGAIARPELFLLLKGKTPGFWTPAQRLGLLFGLMQAYGKDPEYGAGMRLGRMKGWCAYMAKQDPAIEAVFSVLKRKTSLDEALATLQEATQGTLAPYCLEQSTGAPGEC